MALFSVGTSFVVQLTHSGEDIKLSWDGTNFSLETKQLNSVLFEDIAMSMFFIWKQNKLR